MSKKNKKESPIKIADESIEESLERIACSLASIAGVLDVLLKEFLEEKHADSGKYQEKTTPFSKE